MIGAVDADILTYELAFAAETYWKGLHKERGETPSTPAPFEIVMQMEESRVPYILDKSGCSGAEFYFSGENNFRDFIAVTQPYKANRGDRPFNYRNTKAYLQAKYEWYSVDGLEADDLIALRMNKSPGKYICITRDKDIRQAPGWHYGWEVNNQPAFGPYEYDEFGEIELGPKRDKIVGGGRKFFYTQLLTGDITDSIPGIPGKGPVAAYNALKDAQSIPECEEIVAGFYRASYGLYWNTVMREQGRLLNLVTDITKDGKVKLWGLMDEIPIWMNYKTGECFIES